MTEKGLGVVVRATNDRNLWSAMTTHRTCHIKVVSEMKYRHIVLLSLWYDRNFDEQYSTLFFRITGTVVSKEILSWWCNWLINDGLVTSSACCNIAFPDAGCTESSDVADGVKAVQRNDTKTNLHWCKNRREELEECSAGRSRWRAIVYQISASLQESRCNPPPQKKHYSNWTASSCNLGVGHSHRHTVSPLLQTLHTQTCFVELLLDPLVHL